MVEAAEVRRAEKSQLSLGTNAVVVVAARCSVDVVASVGVVSQ